MRLIGVCVIAALSIMTIGSASAETWEAKTDLKPGSKSTCPRAALIMEFSLNGAELTAKARGGISLSGAVSADGKATLYGKHAALGNIVVGGNARTKELQATSSVYPGCIWAFVAGDMNAGLVSAYQGSVGDWALGQWKGRIVGNFAGIGIREYPRSLVVEKLPDGRAGCRYGSDDFAQRLAWVPKCSITANALVLTTDANSTVDLGRVDGRRMEGRVREPGTAQAFTIFLERTQ